MSRTAFISYRRDALGKAFARSLKTALTHNGYDVFLDVDSIDAGAWETQILSEVPKRAHFLLLLTPGALDRCADPADWLRREFEAARAAGRNIVLIREESVDISELKKNCRTMVDVFAFQAADLRHSSFSADIETLIQRFIPAHKAPTTTPALRADISRIDRYAPDRLIGREAEMKRLSDAWANLSTHVLTIVAMGGEGKTSLVARWAADLAAANWPACEAAFAWSFYSQGTRDQMTASADLFLKEALTFFGDPAMGASAQTAFDKGRRLAQLVGERRSLLILDGLEPLQHAPASPQRGELNDQGIAAVLKGLAVSSRGLCVVTTRYSVEDLKAYRQATAPELRLDRLSQEAGVALLQSLGVRRGSRADFERLVKDVNGHALTLNLLGSYLHDAHAGDIRKRDVVKLHQANSEVQSGHAFHVMDAYVKWFESEGTDGKRALAVLRLLGLFDRPASAECLVAVKQPPAIEGLTESVAKMTEAEENIVYSRLETARLLTLNRDGAGTLQSVDAHPLLREYFARKLRQEEPDAWRAAHRRIYEYLCAVTKDKPEPKLEELQPLYQAVAHGCLAGMQPEACFKVYRDRILRGTGSGGFYSINKLGAFGADLGAVACFFEEPWIRVSSSLTKGDQAWILSEAAFRLRALGRLTEALQPMRAGLEIAIKQIDWKNAAIRARNLSELELTLGEVEQAIEHATQSVTHAGRSDDAFQKMAGRTTLADALHQAGQIDEARSQFRQTEVMQATRQPKYPLLYSVHGFKYCDLLLAGSERAALKRSAAFTPASRHGGNLNAVIQACHAVSERAAQTLGWVEQQRWLLDIALDHLTLARATLYASILESRDSDLATATAHITSAVDGLRRAGTQHHIPRGLLTRACLRSFTGVRTGPDSAQTDLDEAWEIAERGPMPLFLADIHLYRARLFASTNPYPWASPQADLEAARRLIEKHGYGRRMPELEDAQHALQRHSQTPRPAGGAVTPAEKTRKKDVAITNRKRTTAMAQSTLKPTDLKGRIHAAIITIRQDEYEAMEARLGPVTAIDGNNSYKLADIAPEEGAPISVVLTRVVGQGNQRAQAVAANVIHELDPAWLILVGIAGGVPDNEFSLGDVVLATYLHDFSLTAVKEGKTTYQTGGGSMHRDVERFLATRAVGNDGKRLRALAGFDDDPRLMQHPDVYPKAISDAARYYGDDAYKKKVEESVSRRFPNAKRLGGPVVCQGSCANGDVLLKDVDLLNQWQQSARQLIQVEMELSGVYEAARTAGREDYPVLSVRGISDIVGFTRHPDWTAYACETAAAYTAAILKSGFIDFSKRLAQHPS
jgi:nucleoside phosphorylase/tetratricopeptide (TPR) repeat protein